MDKVLHSIVGSITGHDDRQPSGGKNTAKVEGRVVLMKKNVLDFNDFTSSVLDGIHELLGQGVSLRLISAVNGDPRESISYPYPICRSFFLYLLDYLRSL